MCLLTVPGHHLLGALDALGRVVAAPDGGLGRAELLGGRAARDLAAVVLHVHVGLATCNVVRYCYQIWAEGAYSRRGSRARRSSSPLRDTREDRLGRRTRSRGRRES